MWIKRNVVMLPTEKAEGCILKDLKNLVHFRTQYFTQEYLQQTRRQAYHLYLTSDEPILKGDWYILLPEQQVKQASMDLPKHRDWKKIITTTDIICIGKESEKVGDYKYLPQPSQEFIDKYIQGYNKGNVITDVLVEYNDPVCKCDDYEKLSKCMYTNGDECRKPNPNNDFYGRNVKINPKDNTITIRKVKDTVKVGEELCSIMQQYHEYCTWSGYITPQKWVEENL